MKPFFVCFVQFIRSRSICFHENHMQNHLIYDRMQNIAFDQCNICLGTLQILWVKFWICLLLFVLLVE